MAGTSKPGLLIFALLLSVSLAGADFAYSEVILQQPSNPECRPTPRPSVVRTSPAPMPMATPVPESTPKPTATPLVYPKPPLNLEPDGPEPETTGSEILDQALMGGVPKSYLPLWHGYPWKRNFSAKVWTAQLVQLLRTDGDGLVKSVPADIERFCPQYENLDYENRLAFWARFISVLAEQESSFSPRRVTHAPTIGSSGVFSTGLMMLSLSSARSRHYGCTMVRTQDDLFHWRKNLACSVRIMTKLIRLDGAVAWNPKQPEPHGWHGIARYWDPIRDTRLKTAKGRQCLDELIDARTPDWLYESALSRHPSARDREYAKAGEKRYERFLRHVNAFPSCHLSTAQAHP